MKVSRSERKKRAEEKRWEIRKLIFDKVEELTKYLFILRMG